MATAKSQGKKRQKKEKNVTTIKLNRETKSRLDNIRTYPKESYEEIIKKILGILNVCKMNPGLARAKLSEIDRQREINGLPR
ncbi:hypothetical protein CO038_00595 [Candidatus Pacearchaeota archaeon CG_4_9_14_0_2_um_filter_39_13]|nr:hypothetical protein [Candidatus Pacearchaeota archaeon]OIO42987.1 MAG: hypothetical protein AUJ64_03380 [Candidatus Pacearchaeota archaeon CG1_02_39_14]PJC45054.1 MAG: hypothetical protein CO038_00595 [Candidatus Pacearchaeota archaeon CG_4_9_14_0_2_um_filter_39_13]